MNFEKYVLDNNLGLIKTNYSFKELTTIGTGGNIRFLYCPNSIKSLCLAFKYINENNLKYFIIGNGSNVLASDDFFDGIVISMKSLSSFIEIYDDYINVSSSYSTSKLAYDLSKLELGDLSYLGGIPGLVGGAIYNNSGAYNKEIEDSIIDVTIINELGEIITLTKDNLDFKYRHSIFHNKKNIIISARFRVEKIQTIDKLKEQLKKRSITQPLEYKNVGSIFKNNSTIEAWKIVDMLNLRGYRLNDAMISQKHANFIVNVSNATSTDILTIIDLVKERAKSELGITLNTEIIII